jgi:hypothetical protein
MLVHPPIINSNEKILTFYTPIKAEMYYGRVLMSAFRMFYGRYNDLIHNYKLSLSHMLSDIFCTNS